MDRSHEVGYENLDWETWHMLTGLPREAYEEWLAYDELTRRDIVGMFQSPDEMEILREARPND